MEARHELTREEMLEAMFRSDTAYDGQFFTCVRTTGIFCFPSCPARKPKPESVHFVRTREEALQLGFRPCKRCHSDLDGGKMEYEQGIVDRVQALVDQHLPTITSTDLAQQVGYSASYLGRLFRQRTEQSLDGYIRYCRITWAAELLRSTEQSILDVAETVGYHNVSSFYAAFQQHYGVAPGAYREQTAGGELK